MSAEQQPQKQNTSKKRGMARRIMRWACWILLSPILLFLFLTILLYIPFVQDWAVGYACRSLSESTGMDVHVERVRLKFPLDVDLRQLSVTKGDTLLAVESCVLDMDLCGIFGGKIGVDAFDLKGGYVDSQDLIATMKLKGRIHDFHLDVHDLELKHDLVNITGLRLKGCDLDIALQDTTIIDTTESNPIFWKLKFADINMMETHVAFHTPCDSMSVDATVDFLSVQDGSFDLGKGLIKINQLELSTDSLHYDQNYQPRAPGLDFNHLALSRLAASLPSLDYDLNAGRLQTELERLALREKCGLEIEEMRARVDLDDKCVHLQDVELKTPTSSITASADIDWTALEEGGKGQLNAQLGANLSRDDLFLLAGDNVPESIRNHYPDECTNMSVDIEGNMDAMAVNVFHIAMPGKVFVDVEGGAGHLFSDGQLSANLHWTIYGEDFSLVRQIAGITDFKLPPMLLEGNTTVRGKICHADLQLKQGRGRLKVNGDFDMGRNAYHADLEADNLAFHHFLPMDSACVVSTRAKVSGCGLDMMADHTRLRAQLSVPRASYGNTNVGDVRLDARLQNGSASLNFYSNNDLLHADGCMDMRLQQHELDSASFAFDLRSIDCYRLGLTQKPFSASMAMHMLAQSNFVDRHYIKGDVSGIVFHLEDTTLYPRDINLETLLRPDTTFAYLSAGDLRMQLFAPEGLATLTDKVSILSDTLTAQMTRQEFNDTLIRKTLPTIDFTLDGEKENPLHNLLLTMGKRFNALHFDLHSSPERGFLGEGLVLGGSPGSIVIDTISFDIEQKNGGIDMLARVANGKKNKDVTFDAHLQANINPQRATALLVLHDEKGRTGVDLGAQLKFQHDGLLLHLSPLRPILAYRHFTLNDSNYICLKKEGPILANLDLLADDGTGLKLFSTPNEDAKQDLTVSLNRFNVGELCTVIPYMPAMGGLLHGDVHYLEAEESTSIMADMEVQQMTFEGALMGDIGLNAAYMPNADGSHFVDGFFTHDRRQMITFNGSYEEDGSSDRIDAQATLEKFPLSLVNGLLGESLALSGSLEGDVGVTGSTSRPIVDGYLLTDSMHIKAPLYSFDLRVVDDTIQFDRSRLNLNLLTGYTTGKSPLVLDGIINFQDLSRILLDVTAKARNFELINAKQTRHAVAYGKAFVDLDARAKGTSNKLDVTGTLELLGNTNLTYVLHDSPINVEDEMSDLVTFCDFSDTIPSEDIDIAPPSNMNMSFKVNIVQSARINCLLSSDGSNYIKLEGGGNFNLYSDEVNGMTLFGRYNILEGKMTYQLLVVSLKDCVLMNGSYVEFNGDISNPRLNIHATERVNSSVTTDGKTRGVAFDVGVSVTRTLKDMGLDFTIEAPEDLSIAAELAQLSSSDRSRTAIALMATGTYISQTNKGAGFSTDGALNSFLQGQINGLAGKTLKNADLSLGVKNNTTQTGATTTDYSFQFAKRFWGNRVSVIVGGKVSSGSEAQNNGQSIIDNVSIEYRLDKSATRYITLYYTDDNTNILEGKMRVMGAGLVLRRKTDRLGDLFLFRRKEE